jgi:hypothetical protein
MTLFFLSWQSKRYAEVYAMGNWITNVMVVVLLGTPILGWPQPKDEMTTHEILKFLSEQAKAYKAIDKTLEELTIQRLFKEPKTYKGKVVMLLCELKREFGFPPPHHNPVDNPNFQETQTKNVFTAYDVKKTSEVIKFGQSFALIGAWREAPRSDKKASRHIMEAHGSMDVYQICGVSWDNIQANDLIRC